MDFLDKLRDSWGQMVDFLPGLFGALVILFVGYLVAKLLERGTDRLLSRLRFNRWMERGGVLEAVEHAGRLRKPSRVVANIVFWFVMFGVIQLAAQTLRLQALTDVFSQLVSYIPSLIAAIVIVLVGIVLGEFVDGLIMASAGAIHGGPTLARIGQGGVVVLAIFMALQQLGVAPDIVTTAFAILFGAAALAIALAFGLGNRELAGEITREWYYKLRAERERIDRDAEERQARESAEERALLGPDTDEIESAEYTGAGGTPPQAGGWRRGAGGGEGIS